MSAETPQKTMSEIADDYEEEKLQELEDRLVARSLLYQLGDGAQPKQGKRGRLKPGQHLLMGDDPRLQEMPEKPTLLDFVRLRFTIGGQDHLLQSARLAANNGAPEKMVLACLLHDIAVSGFIRSDHGYWGAQLIEPYVDEEVSWAIRMHQCVRFFRMKMRVMNTRLFIIACLAKTISRSPTSLRSISAPGLTNGMAQP